MGYLNTMVGFMGFAIGYLPFTLFFDEHKDFLSSTLMVETYHWYELFSPDSIMGQKIILLVWWCIILYGLFYMLKAGARNTGVSTSSLLHKSTEDIQDEIDAGGKAQGGTNNGVNVPVPAPVPN